jgi:hypothetical protein
MAYQPTELRFAGTLLTRSLTIRVEDGQHKGEKFRLRGGKDFGELLLVLKIAKSPRKARRGHYNDGKTLLTLSAPSTADVLRCIGCDGMNAIDPDGFALCFYCDSSDLARHGVTKHIDGNVVKNKDKGFQGDGEDLLEEEMDVPYTDETRPASKAVSDEKSEEVDEPHQAQEDRPEDRPLEEIELAWILAAKYSGFTVRNSKAYKKARLAAIQLAGHYVLGKSYAEIGRVVGKSENAVDRFCSRARKEYRERMVRGPIPEEVHAAHASQMLREFYPPAEGQGYQMRAA